MLECMCFTEEKMSRRSCRSLLSTMCRSWWSFWSDVSWMWPTCRLGNGGRPRLEVMRCLWPSRLRLIAWICRGHLSHWVLLSKEIQRPSFIQHLLDWRQHLAALVHCGKNFSSFLPQTLCLRKQNLLTGEHPNQCLASFDPWSQVE